MTASSVFVPALVPGWYNGVIDSVRKRSTKDKDGAYLLIELTFPGFPAHRVYDRLNIENKNPVAVSIAYQRLNAICHAVGLTAVSDPSELCNRPLQFLLATQPATAAPGGRFYSARNTVVSYRRMP